MLYALLILNDSAGVQYSVEIQATIAVRRGRYSMVGTNGEKIYRYWTKIMERRFQFVSNLPKPGLQSSVRCKEFLLEMARNWLSLETRIKSIDLERGVPGSSKITMSGDYFFGWDLLYKIIEKDINKKEDVLIAFAHFILSKHLQFRCIGLGQEKILTADDEIASSELLPNNWNADEHQYAIRYIYNKQLYLLLGVRAEGYLIITLLDVKTRKVSNISLRSEELVHSIRGSITKMIPSASHLADKCRIELLQPIFQGQNKSIATQTNTKSSSQLDSSRISKNGPRRSGYENSINNPLAWYYGLFFYPFL
uniref:Proteasome inhibitor PI31 subunit n=1 Tax=Glossina brevipalpis TaxID=37001 RepID=A0A1A9WQS9_9MUSC